jgi:hypothetical protein
MRAWRSTYFLPESVTSDRRRQHREEEREPFSLLTAPAGLAADFSFQ